MIHDSQMAGSLFDDELDDESARRSGDPLPAAGTPLAERMRPRTLDEVVGQEEILAPGRPLREAVERDLLQSIILWGPPGTGKTTLARIIAEITQAYGVSRKASDTVLAPVGDFLSTPGRWIGAGFDTVRDYFGAASENADLKTQLLARGYVEGSIAAPGDFVLEKAFVET